MKTRLALFYPLSPDLLEQAVAHCAANPWPVGWDDGVFRLSAEGAFHGYGLLVRVLDLAPLADAALPGPEALTAFLHAAAAAPGVVEAELPIVRAAGLYAEHNRLAAGAADAGTDADAAHTLELLRSAHARAVTPAFAGRVTDDALLPPADVPRRRAALLYPARPGQGEAIQQALTGGRDLPVSGGTSTTLASTSLFRRGDLVVRLIEVAGDIPSGMEHLRRTASRGPGAQRLAGLLRPGFDLRTESGFDRFLSAGRLRPIDDRT